MFSVSITLWCELCSWVIGWRGDAVTPPPILLYITSRFVYMKHLFCWQLILIFLHLTSNKECRQKKKKTLWPLFIMDGVQLPQGYCHFEEAVYFLSFSSQKFLVLILSTSEGWKAESTLEPPSGFDHGAPGLGIQCLNH